MNFPLERPIFQFLYWLVNTPGVGGLAVGLIVLISVSAYSAAVHWIAQGARANERENYAFPTSALHEHGLGGETWH